jgi:hypothetical protein
MNPSNDPALPIYNPAEPERQLLYLDANNLYGWAMSQPLPLGDYVWEKQLDAMPNTTQELPECLEIEAFELMLQHDPQIWFSADMQLITQHILELDPQGALMAGF